MRHGQAYRDEESYLIDRARAGNELAWQRLIELHIVRIRQLGAKFGIERIDAESEGIEKLYNAINGDGRAAFKIGAGVLWTYVANNLSRRFIDMKRKRENRDRVAIGEDADEVFDALLYTEMPEPEIEEKTETETVHAEECEKLLRHRASYETLKAFEIYLDKRRADRKLGKAQTQGIRCLVGLPWNLQFVLFDDGSAGVAVDDFALIGEKVITALERGKTWAQMPYAVGEAGITIRAVRRHLVAVAKIVSGYIEVDEDGDEITDEDSRLNEFNVASVAKRINKPTSKKKPFLERAEKPAVSRNENQAELF